MPGHAHLVHFLIGGARADAMAPRFFSMMDAYDPALRALAHRVADELSVPVQEGVYLGLLGPSFETPAEIRMFRTWGADTVAMSVCEVPVTGLRPVKFSWSAMMQNSPTR